MSRPSLASRRLFLQQCAAFAPLGCAAPLALSLAAGGAQAAATATDYKALVCLFLHGGNDAFNTVLATDDASWQAYTKVRQQAPDSVALLKDVAPDSSLAPGSPGWLGGVVPIAPVSAQAGRRFALHPMLSEVSALFTSRRLAILPNVGPLITPLTKNDYKQGVKARPRKLFSHNDQQSTWMAMAPEGATQGWGGRIADALASANGKGMFTSISLSGHAVWSAGQVVRPYQVAPQGPIRMGATGTDGVLRVFGSSTVGAALTRIVSGTRDGHLMAADLADIAQRSIDAEHILSGALPPATDPAFAADLTYLSIGGARQTNPLALQLQTIARMAAAQGALGMKRQVFFVSLGGFDTHNNQNKNHAELMTKLNHGLDYFDRTLGLLGLRDRVTTFTASDFGRSFTSNGDGTDHGWGGHHFIMGGAVAGGDIHGPFPVLSEKNASDNDFDGSPDQLHNGVLLPHLSVDQYGATLARWFGVSDSEARAIFPHLSNFGSDPFLGFMKA